jgi:isopenicillin N synthase-like dioxygenase
MALALGQPRDFFIHGATNPVSTLRLLHYWPESHNANHSTAHIGAGAHTDYGLLTLLQQDDVGGLQVFNKHTSQWLKVPYIEGALVVNIGDMMERWSSKQFQSTIHRVISNPDKHRYSVPFFFSPNIDTPIQPFATQKGSLRSTPLSFPTCGDVLTEFNSKAGLLK